jgi:hypothetical protein
VFTRYGKLYADVDLSIVVSMALSEQVVFWPQYSRASITLR